MNIASSLVSAHRTTSDRPATPPSDAALGVRVLAILFVVQIAALALVLVGQRFGVIAHAPTWAYVGVIFGSSVVSRYLDRWTETPRGSWRLHGRIAFHALTVMVTIYLTGWGPALGVCFVYAGLVDIQQSGAAAWRAVLGWSLAWCAVGQLLVFEQWFPSFLSDTASQTLGLIGMFAFGIVIRMAGAIGDDRQKAEDQLARSEAHHRAVIEQAAEGILTFDLDGIIGSFNAAAETMFGWSAEEIVGRHASVTVPEALHEPLAQFISLFEHPGEDSGTRSDIEVIGVRRDGTEFPMKISTSLVHAHGTDPLVSCIIRDLSAQRQAEEQLAHQALHDTLTGLPNRAMLTDRVTQALSRVRRNHRTCAVLYLDLDRFKTVNDTLGHAVGDQVLVQAATRIRGAVREADTVGRLGGDEFVVLCEELDGIGDTVDIARRIIDELQSPFLIGSDIIQIGASVGIVTTDHGDETPEAMLSRADIAMYRAKEQGRGRYELFDRAMQDWVSDQIALEHDLRRAVENDELVVHYQPIVAADTGRVAGFEALVRWERPGHGLVPPDVFIPMAEETGMIVEIGAWVLDTACRTAAGWMQRWPDRHLGVSVNVSARQLANADFLDTIRRALASSGLSSQSLTLELTESSLIEDEVGVRGHLDEVRAIGCNLSLDDFGTGYSSLTYLRAFPINVLKVDKSFVRTIGTERDDTAIVAAVLALAKNLDLTVVAEGIETHEQLAVLIQLNCQYFQGYLFSRPVPEPDIARLVDQGTLGLAIHAPGA